MTSVLSKLTPAGAFAPNTGSGSKGDTQVTSIPEGDEGGSRGGSGKVAGGKVKVEEAAPEEESTENGETEPEEVLVKATLCPPLHDDLTDVAFKLFDEDESGTVTREVRNVMFVVCLLFFSCYVAFFIVCLVVIEIYFQIKEVGIALPSYIPYSSNIFGDVKAADCCWEVYLQSAHGRLLWPQLHVEGGICQLLPGNRFTTPTSFWGETTCKIFGVRPCLSHCGTKVMLLSTDKFSATTLTPWELYFLALTGFTVDAFVEVACCNSLPPLSARVVTSHLLLR